VGGPTEPCIIDRGADTPRGGGNFGGCPGHSKVLTIFAASGIIQSPITSCSRPHHSVCQACDNSIWKISRRRRRGLSAAKGVVGLHSVGEV